MSQDQAYNLVIKYPHHFSYDDWENFVDTLIREYSPNDSVYVQWITGNTLEVNFWEKDPSEIFVFSDFSSAEDFMENIDERELKNENGGEGRGDTTLYSFHHVVFTPFSLISEDDENYVFVEDFGDEDSTEDPYYVFEEASVVEPVVAYDDDENIYFIKDVGYSFDGADANAAYRKSEFPGIWGIE